jgi:adenylate cyclase
MNTDDMPVPGWLPTLVVLALAIAFVVADPAGLTSAIAVDEFGLFRALHTSASPLRAIDSIPAQILLLEAVGAAIVLLIGERQFRWALIAAGATALVAQLISFLLFVNLDTLFDTANAGIWILLIAASGFYMHLFRVPEPRRRVAAIRRAAEPVPATEEQTMPAAPPMGETLLLTSLSCGLRNAPSLARTYDGNPTGFVRLLETAMAPLVEDAGKNGAWITRFDGLSFAAQWPVTGDIAHADLACDAADRFVAAMANANETFAEQWPKGDQPCPVLEIAIGIVTGKHVIGALPAQGAGICAAEDDSTVDQIRYLSARYGSAVIIGESTCAAAQRGYAFLEIDYLALDPATAPVRLYALLGNALVRASPKFRAVATFHEHIFRSIASRQWEKARGLIEQCRKISSANQKLYDLHLARIGWYEANPPPPGWDGAFRSTLR